MRKSDYSGGVAAAARDASGKVTGAVETITGAGTSPEAAAAATDATREDVARLTAEAGGPSVVGGTSEGPGLLPSRADREVRDCYDILCTPFMIFLERYKVDSRTPAVALSFCTLYSSPDDIPILFQDE